MKSPWHIEMERAAESYANEAERRRALSRHDPVADTLDWVAADLRVRAKTLGDPTARWTVEQYAAEHGVSPQTVRNWIHAGELDYLEERGRFLIPSTAVRKRGEGHRAA